MKPIIAYNKPSKVSLKKDEEHYFRTYGRSQNQLFNDGTHKHFDDGIIGKEGSL